MALEKEVQTLTHSGAPATCSVAGTDIGYTLVPLLKIDKRKHSGFWPLNSGFASAWGNKSLKARWGKCNFAYRRIWLNLEFGQKAPSRLEYIVVHEIVHLLMEYNK